VDENGVARRIERGKARPHRVAALRAAADARDEGGVELGESLVEVALVRRRSDDDDV